MLLSDFSNSNKNRNEEHDTNFFINSGHTESSINGSSAASPSI